VIPIGDLLRQGITPEKVALSIALGVVVGVFPMLGTTTLLCAGVAIPLRLNLPAIQLVNFLIYPMQLILFLPLLRAGSRLANASPVTMSLKQIFGMMQSDLFGLIKMLWSATVGAVAIWLVLAPIAAAVIYFSIAPILRRAHHAIHKSGGLPV
jgi:uncharacterized protein (DUF2062 family)